MGATRNTGYLENLIQYDASDNVAIATSVNPSYKVTLGGSLLGTSAVFSSSVTASTLTSRYHTMPSGSGFNGFEMGNDATAGGWYLYDLTNSQYRIIVKNNGNVGIGTTSPNKGGVNRALTLNAATSTNASYELSVNDILQGSLYTNISDTSVRLANFNSGDIVFVTGASSTPRMTITSGGSVLINKTNTQSGILQIKHTDANFYSGLSVYSTTADNFTTVGHTGTLGVVSSTYNSTGSYTPLAFYTSDTERMRIRSGGEVSFIPTTWTYVNPSTSYRNMDFGAGGWLYRDNSDVYLTSNNYYNTSGQWVAKYSYNQGVGILSLAGGNFTWNSYDGSVTAGTGYSLSPRFLITSGGDVAIGDTTSDSYRLKVKKSDYGLFIAAGSTTSHSIFIVQDAAQTSSYFRIRGGDGLMFSAPTYNNTTSSAANITVFSDGSMFRSTASSIRFKENITDWNANGLNTILALKPKTFTYKQDYYKHPEKVMLGLIAEEVAEVCPYLADYENEDGSGNVENVRYANIVVPLIKAIQELNQKIQGLENR